MLSKLEWDSDFFELEIGVTSDENPLVDDSNFNLIYFQNPTDINLKSKKFEVKFAEVKVVFQKKNNFKIIENKNLLSLTNLSYDLNSLYELAFESGKFSRFKLDKNFGENKFKLLYQKWVDNSINKQFADEIFVYKEANEILGFVSVKIKNEVGNIGLIAVNPSCQGKGIGKLLIQKVENYLVEKGVLFLNIPTQLENKPACNFYEKLGYQIVEKTFIKHYWKK